MTCRPRSQFANPLFVEQRLVSSTPRKIQLICWLSTFHRPLHQTNINRHVNTRHNDNIIILLMNPWINIRPESTAKNRDDEVPAAAMSNLVHRLAEVGCEQRNRRPRCGRTTSSWVALAGRISVANGAEMTGYESCLPELYTRLAFMNSREVTIQKKRTRNDEFEFGRCK